MHSSRSTSSDRFILEVMVVKMRRFCLLSGRGNSILRSRRPGRKRAGSKVSARLVAMMTLTLTVWSKPSIWVRSSIRIRWTSRSAPVWASKRFVAMASISSIKTIQGSFSLARRKTSRTYRNIHIDIHMDSCILSIQTIFQQHFTIRGPSPRYF